MMYVCMVYVCYDVCMYGGIYVMMYVCMVHICYDVCMVVGMLQHVCCIFLAVSCMYDACMSACMVHVLQGGVLLASHYGTMLPDTLASLAMSGCVGGVALFLLSRSTQSLLGKTLPLPQVLDITRMLKDDPVVVAVYDVKTEVLGVTTVRFKAEIEFNAEAVTRRRISDGGWEDVCRSMRAAADVEGVATGEDWVMKNDSLFLFALTGEIKRLETNIKKMLGPQFTTVHCDLEPW